MLMSVMGPTLCQTFYRINPNHDSTGVEEGYLRWKGAHALNWLTVLGLVILTKPKKIKYASRVCKYFLPYPWHYAIIIFRPRQRWRQSRTQSRSNPPLGHWSYDHHQATTSKFWLGLWWLRIVFAYEKVCIMWPVRIGNSYVERC
jgi:hypothetical protein